MICPQAEVRCAEPPFRAALPRVLGQARLEADSIDALYHFTCQNLGATVLPEHLAARGEATGKLVRLLPDWRLIPLGFFAVWPDTSRRESLTLLFVRFVTQWQAGLVPQSRGD